MELGRECLDIWGYRRVDELIWVKVNQLQRLIRTGRTGHWLNHSKEHCLVGVKGNPHINRNVDCDVVVGEVNIYLTTALCLCALFQSLGESSLLDRSQWVLMWTWIIWQKVVAVNHTNRSLLDWGRQDVDPLTDRDNVCVAATPSSTFVSIQVRETSRKPDEMYSLLERLSPGTRKLEIFARQHNVKPGWVCLGNQLAGINIKEPDMQARYNAAYPNGLSWESSPWKGLERLDGFVRVDHCHALRCASQLTGCFNASPGRQMSSIRVVIMNTPDCHLYRWRGFCNDYVPKALFY